MTAMGNEVVTYEQLKAWGDEKLGGNSSPMTCELTLTATDIDAQFFVQTIDGWKRFDLDSNSETCNALFGDIFILKVPNAITLTRVISDGIIELGTDLAGMDGRYYVYCLASAGTASIEVKINSAMPG